MRKLVVLWLLSVVLVAVTASVLTAQFTPTAPRILSGSDVGFRIEGYNMTGEPVGSIVIRLKGQWVATSAPISGKKLTAVQ